MNPGTHPTQRPSTHYNASLAEPTGQQVELLEERPKAVKLSWASDSEYGVGEAQGWFPRRAIGLRKDDVYGLMCDWCAGWLADKLAHGDHRAILIIG